MSAWGALQVTGGGEGGGGVCPPTWREGLGVLSHNLLRKSVTWCNLVHSESGAIWCILRVLLSSRPTDHYLT